MGETGREPPHPVCDMKSGERWEGVITESHVETAVLTDLTG